MPKNVLIISNCRLGDALVMIPALRSIKALPAQVTLASESAAPGIVAAEEILGGRGLVDRFVTMSTAGGLFSRGMDRLRFIAAMRHEKWDLGIVLMPPCPPLTMRLVRRLRLYLRLCGCRHIIAPQCVQCAGKQVADMMLEMLASQGIAPIADATLPSSDEDGKGALHLDGQRCIAVAPAANMPANCWALENYATVLKALTVKYKCIPVYFSGENERASCEWLNERIPGTLVIGKPLHEAIGYMRQCRAYLGNDTGLIHLAASLGLPCIGVYSNRNAHGLWVPCTARKLIFYPKVGSCAGCLRTKCDKMCINEVSPEQIIAAVENSSFLK